jgi:hypothetical protein
MTITELKYKLNKGFIHNWLVAGPLAVSVANATPDLTNVQKLEIMRQYHDLDGGVSEIPVDLGPLGSETKENPLLTWRYYRCRDDHYVDLTSNYATCQYIRSWAYTQVITPSPRVIEVELTMNTPIVFWVNGQIQCRLETFHDFTPKRDKLSFTLKPGINEFLFRMDDVGIRETINVLALQIQGVAVDDIEIVIPTTIDAELLTKRIILERLIEKAYLERYVYGNMWGDRYNRNQPIPLKFSSDMEEVGDITFRLQSLLGDIFVEGKKEFGPGSCYELAKIFPLRNGPHHLALLPPVEEYYIKKLRFERKDLFYVVRTPYSQSPYGSYQQRVKEALVDASQRRNESIYCEIAKIANDQSQEIDRKVFSKVIVGINRRDDGSIRDVLGVLGLMFRFRRGGKIPGDLKSQLKACILNYRYWVDEPGNDVMDFHSESEQFLFHTCEMLAGQLFTDLPFKNIGKSGAWHKEHGEKLASDWLQQHGQYGFREWDSTGGFEAVLAGLSHLVDLANANSIRDLAAVVMDKILFSIVINSFQGAYGSTRGKTDTASVLSARLEPTSGISRLFWGLGNYNESLMGTVSLACCKQYELPDIIQKIGEDSPATFWNREHHGVDLLAANPVGVDKVSYKTNDFMLSSAQDYHPGEKGHHEHIWQATLGPDAIVYTNHPTCLSEEDAHQPNLWAGNGVLPRVAQWGGVLIALYKLPPDDWLGFTHAYFPALSFDEYKLEGKWAFARKGDGYLALTAARGFEFIQEGQTAFRELRSFGGENIWLCHMGQALLDGSFDDFQQQIIRMNVNFDKLSLCVNSLRGDTLSFDWVGPLVVNNQEQATSGLKHYDNIYCVADFPVSQMDIIYKDEGLRLKFM